MTKDEQMAYYLGGINSLEAMQGALSHSDKDEVFTPDELIDVIGGFKLNIAERAMKLIEESETSKT